MHNDIVKYKGYEFQISCDKKYLITRGGLRKYKIPQPYLLGRNKKWRIDVQFGIDRETGKRIRKSFFFDSQQEAFEYGIYCVLKREIDPRIELGKQAEKIMQEAKEILKYHKEPKIEKKIPVRKKDGEVKLKNMEESGQL
ncbi:MAG: hypothetical protein ABDH49_08550 [Candidatus Hydrothermales bacterium]